MKKIFFLSVLFYGLLFGSARAQQNRKPANKKTATPDGSTTTKPVKQPGNTGWIDDSLLWVKNPGNGKVGTTTRGNAAKTTATNSRTTQPVKKPGNQGWIDDSLLWIKNPANGPYIRNQRTATSSNQPVNNTKLDDLKNPFDTTKKAKPVKAVRN